MKTIKTELEAGMKSGKFPDHDNDVKVVQSVVTKKSESLVRAYWSGYICQRQVDGWEFENI